MLQKLQRLWFGGVVIGLFVSIAHAQDIDREVFLISYPNAQIEVDGDASDWNLDQFSTVISGGMNPFFEDDLDWERTTGTGDIAQLGWDDAGEMVLYGARWQTGVLPEEPADNSVKFYARDNMTHQYFLVDIIDDEINTDDPEQAAWANDSVEFYFDPEDDGDPTEWQFDVQLVIDAANRVQVWNSPPDYEAQVEAGIESEVTITENGWLLEVGIQKDVFDSPLPAILGSAEENSYGLELSYRDNDNPDGLDMRNGDTMFSTAYVWADGNPTGGGFPNKAASGWGRVIAGEASEPPPVTCNAESMGDLDGNGKVEFADFLVLSANFGSEVEGHAAGDIDCNGTVEFADFLVMSANFGSDVAASPVPEPSGAMLVLTLCGFALHLRRRD